MNEEIMYGHPRDENGEFIYIPSKPLMAVSREDDNRDAIIFNLRNDVDLLKQRLARMDKAMGKLYEAIRALDRKNNDLAAELDNKVDHRGRDYL